MPIIWMILLMKNYRVVVSTEWELKYPNVVVKAMEGAVSDHVPLLLDTGDSQIVHHPIFRFELCWLIREGFADLIANFWAKPVQGRLSIGRWQNRLP